MRDTDAHEEATWGPEPETRLTGRVIALGLCFSPLPLTVLAGVAGIRVLPKFEQICAELSIRLPTITTLVIDCGGIGLALFALVLVGLPLALLAAFRRSGTTVIPALAILALLNLVFAMLVVVALFLPLFAIIEQLGSQGS